MYTYADGSKHTVPPIRRKPTAEERNISTCDSLVYAYSLYPVQFIMPAYNISQAIKQMRSETVAGGPLLDALEDTALTLVALARDSEILQRSVKERESLSWKERVSASDPELVQPVLCSMRDNYVEKINVLNIGFRDFVTHMNEYRDSFSPEYTASFNRFITDCEKQLQSIDRGMQAVDGRVHSIIEEASKEPSITR